MRTRIPIEILFDHLEADMSIDEFLADFPTVKKEQAIKVVSFASKLLSSKTLIKQYENFAGWKHSQKLKAWFSGVWSIYGSRNGLERLRKWYTTKQMLEKSVNILVTADKNLQHQQNFKTYPIPVILLSVSRLTYPDIKPLIPKLISLLKTDLPAGSNIISKNN